MFSKLYGKLLGKLYQKYMTSVNKKKITEQQKKQQAFYKELKVLYNFIDWLNKKGLKNRQHRKTFWKSVQHNESVVENVLQDLISQYAPKKKEKSAIDFARTGGRGEKPDTPKPVMLKEGNVKKGGIGTVPTTPSPIVPKGQGKRNS